MPRSRLHAAVIPARRSSGRLASKLPARLPFTNDGGTEIYYVNSATGNNSRTATQAKDPATPWLTIGKAISEFNVNLPTSGVTIRCTGTFSSTPNYGSIALNWTKAGSVTNPWTIEAWGDGATIVNSDPGTGPTYGAWIFGPAPSAGTGLRIKGFTFNVRGNGGAHILVEDGADMIEMYRCRFIESGGGGVSSRGRTPGSGPTTNIRWEACEFGTSDASPITFDGSADKTIGLDLTDPYYKTKGTHVMYLGDASSGNGVDISGSENEVVANCIFYGSTPGRHIQLGPQFREGFVVNNTFYFNKWNGGNICSEGNPNCEWFAAGGVEIWVPSGAYATSDVVVANNVFQQMGGHAVYGSGSGGTACYVFNNIGYECDNGYGHQDDELDTFEETYAASSTLYAETKPDGSSAPNSVTNPLISSPTTRAWNLANNSPAKGASLIDWTPTHDFGGNARNPDAPTIGAVE